MEEKDALLAEMRTTLSTVKDLAAETGVTKHSDLFGKEAQDHLSAASRWLLATGGFGFSMFLYAAYFIWNDAQTKVEANLYASINFLAPRLTILLVIGFALVWSARNYASSKHNQVVNRHRQNALNSFETFAKGAQDKETKNAVLLQATQSIFSPQDTAFSKNDPPTAPGAQIIEIVRGISGSKAT